MKLGSRWKSRVCGGEVVVVRPPSTDGVLTCGGAPMLPFEAVTDTPPPSAGPAQTLAGKRHVDAESGLELLCTKSGAGALAFAGRGLALKDVKRLPSSD